MIFQVKNLMLMRTNSFISIFFIFTFWGCSPEFSECNDLLDSCKESQTGEYCIFGYKWGETPEFLPSGLEEIGPQSSGGIITYSIHTEIKKVSTHQKNDLESINFDDKGECARDRLQAALKEWEMYGNFVFLQEEDNSPSNIRFIAAKEVDNNNGNPNYQDEQCSEIGGQVVFNNKEITNCHSFFILSLHEIGHVLGLGHVNSANIMQQGSDKFQFSGLQDGDKEGIIAIYGEK